MYYKKYVMNIVHFFVAPFATLSAYIFYLTFCCIFSERFLCMQVKLEFFSPGIVSALENKELLSHFRAYRKSATSAQTDGRITTDGPLNTGLKINQNYLKLSHYYYQISH